MTKAELIRKMAKNVGVPDSDAKIFFELFLKRISAIVETGQSISLKDFGYFHLIKGSIKKPVFSFNNNEISEEEVDLVLFSEDKDLRKSETKGLVFNIPIFDEEDYHPIDSAFSLSIGKPLIPLRGVPFDSIYIQTSGYEYRRLIESKVEKIISESEIAESLENFPTLVIDARSYNSNQVQLRWNEIERTDTKISDETETNAPVESGISEYEKQSKELKNIAWDFGEDLSRQIEADSILDITDERLSNDLKENKSEIKINESSNLSIEEDLFEEETDLTKESEREDVNIQINESELSTELLNQNDEVEASSEKLDELLNDNSFAIINSIDENILEDEIEIIEKAEFEFEEENKFTDENENSSLLQTEVEKSKNEDPDKEFWESTSKYFEEYKITPDKFDTSIDEDVTDNLEIDNKITVDSNLENELNSEIDIINDNEIIEESASEGVIESLEENSENLVEPIEETLMEENKTTDDQDILKQDEEQKPEYFEPNSKRNIVPFILFPLLVIILSLALYWYLEFYKKNEVVIKQKEVVLNSDNANMIKRNFDIPVTYPYPIKVNETTISKSILPEENIPIEPSSKNEDKKNEQLKPDQTKPEQLKPIEKKIEKVVPNKTATLENQKIKSVIPTGKSLNVGDNIFKYGDYYVVQVASFRALSISENEAGKYRNKGYNAFVETAEIPERGTWYRVRVGNFSSKEEAQNFIKKNIR